MNPYKVFHSACESLREKLHVVLVRPEQGGNVGSVARVMANMGIKGSLRIVGAPDIVDSNAWKMAKHARSRLENTAFFGHLSEALRTEKFSLRLAATARVGSSSRPHPLWAAEAVPKAVEKLRQGEIEELFFVF